MNDLTPDEVTKVRELISQDERATWAWKKVRFLVPVIVAVIVAIWQAFSWLREHVRFQ
jgi:hypothetical protein